MLFIASLEANIFGSETGGTEIVSGMVVLCRIGEGKAFVSVKFLWN